MIVTATAAMTIAAGPLVEKLAVELITPKIKDFVKFCKGQYDENLIPKAEHFKKYLETTYEKYSTVNTLVFKNSQVKLKDIYVAQTLEKVNQFNDKKGVTKKIDKLPVKLIKEYKKILITDTAGMGKSTITRRMFLDIIDTSLTEVGIPVYIELNRLRKDHDIITEIHKRLNTLSEEFDKELLLKLIQKGGFIFFLDGYDEISIADRIAVTNDIQYFISKAGTDNYYILTSRPEEELTVFGDFQAFKIKALNKDEAFDLLKKYDMTPEKEISGKIIEALESGDYRAIDEYLKNPLLVSLLFSAYNHKHEIPIKKHLFYSQVYDAFFDCHDLSKGIEAHQKRSGLAIDDFSRILRYIGLACLVDNKISFDKDSIIKVIKKAKDFCVNLDFKESDFFSDLLTSVPLFCKDGNEYKWVHKSLMEYFAARFIAEDAKNNQDKILEKIYNSKSAYKYINLFDLYYDIDYLGFVKNIELPLLRDYIKFYNNNIFESSKIRKEYIEARIGYLYAQKIHVLKLEKNKDVFFEDIKKYFENIFETPIYTIAFLHNNIFIGYNILPEREILYILSKRRKELFDQISNMKYKEFKYSDITFENINAHTGEEDEKEYKEISNLVMLHSKFSRKYLNYQKCCDEVEKINNKIKENEDSIFLVDEI